MLGPEIQLKEGENSLCVGFFLKMCIFCRIFIEADVKSDGKVVRVNNTEYIRAQEWTEAKYNFEFKNITGNTTVQLYFSTNSIFNANFAEFWWHLDNVRRCSQNGTVCH